MNRGQLILVILLVLLACGGLVYFGIPALQSALPKTTPTTAATPDYEATVQARLAAAAPTPVAQATPNIEATVQARLTASAPRPTTIPTAAAPVATSAPTSGGTTCMTDSVVMALFHFAPGEIVRTDAPWDQGKWNRQNVPSTISFSLVPNWGLTYTDVRGNVWVTLGKGQNVTVRGFTLRQPGCNQVLAKGPQGYLDFEWGYGYSADRGTATYPHCPDENMIGLVTLTAEQQSKCAVQGTKPVTAGAVVPTVAIVTGTGPSDPAYNWNAKCFDVNWIASNIGGPSTSWMKPDWDGGAAVFKQKGTFIQLRYPGFGSLDVWIGSGPVSVTSTNAAVLSGKTFDEASFHCR